MLADAGSIPAASTNIWSLKDHSRPTKTLENQGLSQFPQNPLSVSNGLNRPRLWHKFDTNLSQVIQADELTSKQGTEDCRRFRQHVFSDLSPFAIDLAIRYNQTVECFSYEKANQELFDIHERLRIGDLNLCADTDELKETAKHCAEKCRSVRQQAKTSTTAYKACSRIVELYGLAPPASKDDNLDPSLNRMCNWLWWFRKIKILRLRNIDEIARNIELVSRCRSTYASDYTVKLKRKQKQDNRRYLESTFVSNEKGESFSLQDLADRSVSNPANRRAELMVRIKGFEMVADILGHVGEFYTLTTPSRMHACLNSGRNNPRFDGTTTLQAQKYLTHLWALIRSELNRQGIRPYGFRVVEPHHDGTPHWHLLLFMPHEHREIVRDVMRQYALAENGNEPGAQTHRFKAVAIDPAKGTAAGYIAKYIAKNIDGHNLTQDLYGNDAVEASERITAWANIWGIRQFQQIGGPSVTVWRQLRRLEKSDDDGLEYLRSKATSSNWAAFMLAMGGYEMPRSAHPIKPLYGFNRQLNLKTGEIILKTQDGYGGDASKLVVGVSWKSKDFDTRKHFWSVSNRDSETGWDGCAAQAEHRPASSQLSALNCLEAFEAAADLGDEEPWAEPLFLDLYQ